MIENFAPWAYDMFAKEVGDFSINASKIRIEKSYFLKLELFLGAALVIFYRKIKQASTFSISSLGS